MVTKIMNGRLLLPEGMETGLSLYFEGGKITCITALDLPYDRLIDAGGDYVSPGFIDGHVHGGGGYDFMDGDEEAIIRAADFHLRFGTTTILPTALAASREALVTFLQNVRHIRCTGATKGTIPGVHIEGPYFSPRQAGAQNPVYIRHPDPKEYQPLLEEYGEDILRWSFAPELPGSEAFCRALLSYGVSPSIAHSDGVYEDVKRVYDAGCRMVTHLYSGMSTITRDCGYRRLGVLESAYLLKDMGVEIIADGKHLPPELLRLILLSKSYERVCLVTDAMRAAGTTQTQTMLGPKDEAVPCIVEDGVAKLPDRTAFAGSVATTDRLVRTMVKQANVSVERAVAMITAVPAKQFGLMKKGELRVGNDADIVIFNEDIIIQNVIAGGNEYGDPSL